MIKSSRYLLVVAWVCAAFSACAGANLGTGEHLANVNGLHLRYRLAGSGPTLVVQPPGWGYSASIYEQSLTELERDFRVLYYDPRGSGGSQTPKNMEHVHVGTQIEDLEELVRQLGIERFALLGHSHGAFVATNYALRYPARLTHLILVAPLTDREDLVRHLTGALPRFAREARFASAVASFGRLGTATTDEQFTQEVDGIMPLYFHDPANLARFRRYKLKRISPRVYGAVSSADGRFAVRDKLHQIAVPTLVLAGDSDRVTPLSHARIASDAIQKARLVRFSRSGHFPWIEEPNEFYRAVRTFVRGQ